MLIRDGDPVCRGYLVADRGDEAIGRTRTRLDITPPGRQEEWEDSPEGCLQTPPRDCWTWHGEARGTSRA